MTLQWDRTHFDKGAKKVFHVVPLANKGYDELVRKYGKDSVFRGDGTYDNLALAKAVAACGAFGTDVIRLYPGTLVFADGVTVNKSCAIEGASDNPGAAILDCATNDCDCMTISAAGVTLRNFTITEADSGTDNCVTSSAVGTVLDNVTINGGAIANSTATVSLTGAYSRVVKSRLFNINKGISIAGAGSTVEDTIVYGSTSSAATYIGVTFTGAAATEKQMLINSIVCMRGTTTATAVSVLASADNTVIVNNALYGVTDPLIVQTDTWGVGNFPLTTTTATAYAWLAE